MTVANLAKAPMISIVDDDEAVREATKGLVRSLGYSATTFASAEEFLHSDRVKDTSCLITDVQMPGTMDGVDLSHYIRARWPPVKLIIASGAGVIAEIGLPWGSRFFSKPYDDQVIAETIAHLLAGDDSRDSPLGGMGSSARTYP